MYEYTLDHTQPKVIMETELQLLVDQVEQSCDLACQVFGVLKAIAVEGDLTDEADVWLDHCHISEEGLQIVWEGGPSDEVWVHCDEDGAMRRKFEDGTFKIDVLLVVFLGSLDGDDQRGDVGKQIDL